MIYLDHNATTPIDPAVAEAMRPYLSTAFGNPSSEHGYGREPRAALDRARGQVADLIGAGGGRVAGLTGASGGRIVFTGSGSEADNLAIRGAVLAAGRERPQVITQRTEHPAVLAACAALARWHGVEVCYLPVDRDGLVSPDVLAESITDRTVLVSIMTANNETGALQPVAELACVAHEHGALFHTDAAQAIGKIPFDVGDIDLVTVVGHKMYAPKGVGALFVRDGVPLEPLVYGGGQEHGLRAGTENVALAVALGTAAELARTELADGGHERMRQLRDRLHDRLVAGRADRVSLNGPVAARLPNTLNVSIRGVVGHELVAALPDIAVSTGSACHNGDHEPSPVLTAMGLAADRGLSALRLSLGRSSTAEEIGGAAEQIIAAAR